MTFYLMFQTPSLFQFLYLSQTTSWKSKIFFVSIIWPELSIDEKKSYIKIFHKIDFLDGLMDPLLIK